jgi:hypothetical protein
MYSRVMSVLRACHLQRVVRQRDDIGSKLLPKVQNGNLGFGCRPSCWTQIIPIESADTEDNGMQLRALVLALVLGLGLGNYGRAQETVASPFLKVSFDAASGAWNCAGKDGAPLLNRAVASADTSIGVLRTTDARFQRSVSTGPFQDALGSGKQLVLTLKDRQGEANGELAIKIYNQFAGLRLDWQLQNAGKRGLNLRQVTVLEATGAESEPPPAIHVLTSGVHSWEYSHMVTLKSGVSAHSHDLLAVDNPRLVAGYLSASTTYGTFEYDYSPSRFQSTAEFNVLVDPGQARRTDPLLLLFPENLFDGLERYASAVQKFNGLHPLQHSTTAWCSCIEDNQDDNADCEQNLSREDAYSPRCRAAFCLTSALHCLIAGYPKSKRPGQSTTVAFRLKLSSTAHVCRLLM